MVHVRISQWDGSRHKSLGVRRRPAQKDGFPPYPETWVEVPHRMHPADAIALVGTLDLTDEEAAAFIAEMEKRLYCRCGAAPAVIMGYSSGFTGQVSAEPYCGPCLDQFFDDMGHVLRSAGVHAYPGIDEPRYPDGRLIPGVEPVPNLDG